MNFGKWDEEIHRNRDQRVRFVRAQSSEMKIKSINDFNKTGLFHGSTGELYQVSLNSCTCQDFQKRELPCKHIYRLAIELGYVNGKTENNTNSKDLKTRFISFFQSPSNILKLLIIILGLVLTIIFKALIWIIVSVAVVMSLRKVKVNNVPAEEDMPDLTPLPIDVSYLYKNEPSERQLAYARNLGIEVLDSHCSADVSDMISRFEDEDYEKPPLKLAQYALDIGAEITPYIGANALIEAILQVLSAPEHISFYAYAVYCSIKGKELDNFKESALYDELIEFGNVMVDDEELFASLNDRPYSDYYKPNRRTNAFSITRDFFKNAIKKKQTAGHHPDSPTNTNIHQ